MLQLKNSTPFSARLAVHPDKQGVESLYLTVKATFAVGRQLALADQQIPPVAADEYWGEPGASSLRYAAEMHLCKPATDIALVGSAWPARGRPASQLDVLLAVGNTRKVLRVFGDRQWRSDGALGSPAPFESMPIVYERAFGGVDEAHASGGEIPAEARNPVGLGFLGKRKARELAGRQAPNIEDPARLISKAGDKVTPAGFGFIAPNWQPRVSFAGTYDAAWQEQRAPYLPDDFDERFFSAAHPDLVCRGHLRGGEPVQAVNLSAGGPLRFNLPACRFRVGVKIAGNVERPQLNMETVLLEPDAQRLCMLWRAVVPCDKQALAVERVSLALEDLQLA